MHKVSERAVNSPGLQSRCAGYNIDNLKAKDLT